MTLSRHRNSLMVSRGSRTPLPSTGPRVSMFYELNPHLRKKKAVADDSIASRIGPWLSEHGPATAKEIAAGIGAGDVSSINELFRLERIPGAYVVGIRKTGKSGNKNTKVWGIRSGE